MTGLVEMRPLGIKQAAKNLETLGTRIQQNIVRQAVRAAVRVIAKAIKATTYAKRNRITGLLEKSQAVTVSAKKSGEITGSVKMRRVNVSGKSAFAGLVRKHRRFKKGKTVKVASAFYWRFLEKGTKHIAAKPWVVPAFDSNARAAIAAFESVFKTRIDEETGKLPKGVKP